MGSVRLIYSVSQLCTSVSRWVTKINLRSEESQDCVDQISRPVSACEHFELAQGDGEIQCIGQHPHISGPYIRVGPFASPSFITGRFNEKLKPFSVYHFNNPL